MQLKLGQQERSQVKVALGKVSRSRIGDAFHYEPAHDEIDYDYRICTYYLLSVTQLLCHEKRRSSLQNLHVPSASTGSDTESKAKAVDTRAEKATS